MKLSELPEHLVGPLTSSFELATLHCLRSIAVNLELLVIQGGLENHSCTARQFGKMSRIAEQHSVGDRLPDNEEEKESGRHGKQN